MFLNGRLRWAVVLAVVVCALAACNPKPTTTDAPLATSASPPVAGLPKIVILTTGGTIASRVDPATGQARPVISGPDLVAAVPGLKNVANLEVEEIARTGSADIAATDWMALLRAVNRAEARSDVAGIVVTHGTDTLEETAFFLDVTAIGTKPIVVTGAQRLASDPDPDGPNNLLNAARVAVSSESGGKGVLVVLHGEINAARNVAKTNTTSLDTFKSLSTGPLGTVDDQGVRFAGGAVRRIHIDLSTDTNLPRVEIVLHYAGADGAAIRALLSRWPGGVNLGGIVVAATGVGDVSRGMYDAIKEARNRGIPVVISTRVFTGSVTPIYPGKGRGKSLQEIGCVFSDDLSPYKARVLLMVALTHTTDTAQLQRYFTP